MQKNLIVNSKRNCIGKMIDRINTLSQALNPNMKNLNNHINKNVNSSKPLKKPFPPLKFKRLLNIVKLWKFKIKYYSKILLS